MALKPLRDEFGVAQVRVATYQSVSGAGRPAQDELLQQTKVVIAGGKEASPVNYRMDYTFWKLQQKM